MINFLFGLTVGVLITSCAAVLGVVYGVKKYCKSEECVMIDLNDHED